MISYLLPVLSKYNTAPKFYAKTSAASLPLGSINPYNKSSMDIHVLDWRLEDVPLMDDDHEVILKNALLMLMLYFRQMSIQQMHVMVFVILAIYRFVLDRNPFLLILYLVALLGWWTSNFLLSVGLVMMLSFLLLLRMSFFCGRFLVNGSVHQTLNIN